MSTSYTKNVATKLFTMMMTMMMNNNDDNNNNSNNNNNNHFSTKLNSSLLNGSRKAKRDTSE